MRAGDEAFEELRRTIGELAAQDAPALIAEARIEARAKVRSILVEAMAQELLERSRAELDAARQPPGKPEQAAAQSLVASIESEPAPEQPGPSPAPDAPSPDLAWYVYGVVGSGRLGLAPELPGVDKRWSPTVIAEGDLAAVASHVPLSEFGDESLRDNLGDSAWLEEKARSHENVLEDVRRLTTVIPMRLCTIYKSESSVRELLSREREWFTTALERLAGKAEWGVKVFGHRRAIERATRERSPELSGLDPGGAKNEGEAYMRAKRLERLLDERVDRFVDQCTLEIHERLSGIAAEALINPLQRPEVTGHSGEMVLNGVYLVDEGVDQELHRAVEALRAEYEALGFDLVPTGPWPPYNFVKDSLEAALT